MEKPIKKTGAGRPTAEQALKRALAPFKATGFDPALIDPRAVLSVIASDPNAPWDSRIAACAVLLGAPAASPNRAPDQPAPTAQPDPALDVLNQRAIQRMKDGK